ncbi:VWA domain-containing protein [Scytonema tolypothrichoides VB-61278]|nr:VWA domain-containing protein [Scytonema tolypothrichoides VB-61278]
MAETSTTVTPGQNLNPSQKIGLELVSCFRGRDVVLAIDLTESVGLNDEGRFRLRQIVEDSLKPGDSVYVVPFGKDLAIGEVTSSVNPLGTPIQFNSQSKENIDKVLEKIPFVSDPNRYGADIQRAELSIYQGIAQINQNRLRQNQSIKPQSVVWVTDAPLLTKAGITSQVWVETPADSPFRIANSPESQQRQAWREALQISKRSQSITTKDNKEYKLTVVDIAPTVQEFCTPAPGGQETCLVTPYLIKQLWLPGLISLLIFAGFVFALIKFYRLQKKWELIVDFEDEKTLEDQKCRLPNNKRIAIGDSDATCVDSIDTPGLEVRAYLERKGEKLYLVPTNPTNLEPIYYKDQEIRSRTLISSSKFTINCPDDRQGDYKINIKVKK